MGDTNSKRVVAELMAADPNVRDKGFPKSVAALQPDSRYFAECARRIRPDAFKIVDGVVTIYEVVDTHPIRPAKAEHIAELADELDDIGLELAVLTLDYTGHVTSALPGYAYFPIYTSRFASEACLDMTPAARAVMRDDAETRQDMTPEELRRAFASLLSQ